MATARVFVVEHIRKSSGIEGLEKMKNRTIQDPADEEPPVKCVYCGDADCDRHQQEKSKFSSSMALRVGAVNNDGPPPRCPYCGDSDCDRHEPEVRDEYPGHGGSAGE